MFDRTETAALPTHQCSTYIRNCSTIVPPDALMNDKILDGELEMLPSSLTRSGVAKVKPMAIFLKASLFPVLANQLRPAALRLDESIVAVCIIYHLNSHHAFGKKCCVVFRMCLGSNVIGAILDDVCTEKRCYLLYINPEGLDWNMKSHCLRNESLSSILK